ncbi:MAG: DUF2029 domain-containing protein [Bacteroidetes bacterium]|nr:DUF2029 domain-containing protein [Bacteroidota bacterium]
MFKKLKDFLLQKPIALLFIYLLLAAIATLQEYNAGLKKFVGSTLDFTYYNNYLIFKYSFFHLLEGADLYAWHLNEHWDLYKYSPTFAFLFGSLVWLPNGLGLMAWNSLNVLALFFGVQNLKLKVQERNIILLLCAVELFTTLQNAQSNALIAGLIILAFALIEKEKFFWACLCIALTVYIKLFGVFAFAICLLYRERWKMVGYSALAMVILAALPLMVTSFDQLKNCYISWWALLQKDYIPNHLSFVGVVKAWFGIRLQPNLVLLLGIILFLITLIRAKFYDQFNFRLSFLAMILLWMIVFNHKVESPTFIIALAGIGVWFVSTGIESKWKIALALFAWVFTSLSPTDLFPNFVQENFFEPWSVKAIPCIVIYFFVFYELTFRPNQLTNR